ncbi:MAG TPA: flagellar motor switch phosphatase FliY [Firmicutes bacterium]|nr:flagellar motor switch phosphatase FliY [Bacillota bacterium]
MEIGSLDDTLKDVIAEIGNISMGSAATALSSLTSKEVRITTPTVKMDPIEEIEAEYPVPAVVTRVCYTEGLVGENLFVVSERDARVIADLMMGGSGDIGEGELGEIELSAISEAMNQMMGAASTAMSTILNRKVSISPPDTQRRRLRDSLESIVGITERHAVKITFRMTIEDKVNSDIVQIMPLEFSSELARAMLEKFGVVDGAADKAPAERAAEAPVEITRAVPAFIPDVPIEITVRLGRTRLKVFELESLEGGDAIELDALEGQEADVLCGGVEVARGQVVVVGDRYGVKITKIHGRDGNRGGGR